MTDFQDLLNLLHTRHGYCTGGCIEFLVYRNVCLHVRRHRFSGYKNVVVADNRGILGDGLVEGILAYASRQIC
ncbi:hypothetical protein D3C80_2019370 [compost metagenome]